MESYINIKGTKIALHLQPQTSPDGRPFRLSGISKNLEMPEKWVNKTIKNHWIYSFIFLDKEGGFIYFEFDYYDNFVRLLEKI